MDHQGEFRRAALDLGVPGDEVSAFSRYLRLSIGLPRAGEGDVPVGQFGGVPRLPVGMEWPCRGDSPLPFLLSVDCGALPRVDGLGLPADGTLLFFVDQERDHEDRSGEYARVVYVPGGEETSVVQAPGSVDVRERSELGAELRAELPLWLQEGDEDWHEYWEDLEREDMSAFQQELAAYMERELPHLDELRDLAHSLWSSRAGVFVGGYVDDEVIHSLAEQTLAGRERAGEIPAVPIANWPSRLEEERHRLTGEWMSLAGQARSYEEYCTSFVVRRDDLAVARMDKVLPVTRFEAP
jgi:hypothetical protein